MKEARFMVATGAPRTSAFHFHSQFDKNHAVSIAACSQNDINGGNRNPMPVIDPRFDSIKTLNKMLAIASPQIERERERKKRKEKNKPNDNEKATSIDRAISAANHNPI